MSTEKPTLLSFNEGCGCAGDIPHGEAVREIVVLPRELDDMRVAVSVRGKGSLGFTDSFLGHNSLTDDLVKKCIAVCQGAGSCALDRAGCIVEEIPEAEHELVLLGSETVVVLAQLKTHLLESLDPLD